MRGAALLLALAATGCAHGAPSPGDCAARQVPSALQALPAILSLWDPPPAMLRSGFALCSRDESRLLAAASALGEQGYSSYIGAARRGKCLRVARTHEASAAALEREVRTMCRVADAHGIAYRVWQVDVSGKSRRPKGRRVTLDGEGSRGG